MSTLLRNATLWDGVGDDARPHVDVLIEGTAIASVRPTGQAPAGATVLDLDGAFLMPGLIDMHVHLVWSGDPDPAATVEQDGQQLTTIRAVANARAELEAGVTTVRDVGSYWDLAITLARAVDRGHIVGPRIVASGQTIIMTGGHDPFWGLPSDGVDAIVRSVRRQVTLGAGLIKVSATGGVYGRPEAEEIGQSELSFDELQAAASEAHRFGLRVSSHALGREGIRNSVLAGIDTIEHGHFLDEEIVAEMKRRGTILCPTLYIYQIIADGAGGEIPRYAMEKSRKAEKAHREAFQMAMEAGIPMVAGTDAGSCSTPHPSLVKEMVAMAGQGMPIPQVLRAATTTAAEALGRGSQFGTIEPGKRADLVALEANPLEDLSALERIKHVVRSGVLIR